jgi:hypothetical protein
MKIEPTIESQALACEVDQLTASQIDFLGVIRQHV